MRHPWCVPVLLSVATTTALAQRDERAVTALFPIGVCSREGAKLVGTQPINSIRVVVDGGWKFADGEQTVQLRNVKLNGTTFLTPTTPTPVKVNPTTACKAQQAALGRTAFNELWAKSGTMNGFGKCVSAAAKARNLAAMQTQIMNASKACKAKGLKGERLGQCVAATDRVAATATEAAERKASKRRK